MIDVGRMCEELKCFVHMLFVQSKGREVLMAITAKEPCFAEYYSVYRDTVEYCIFNKL